MTRSTAEVVVIGAGIAGVSAAYHLAVGRGLRDVVLVDERAPLTLTSDKSTECYRNWWPGPGDAMVAFMNRSIDILEVLSRESNDRFRLNRRGYLFATADPERAATLQSAAEEAAVLGSGPLRRHTGSTGEPRYVPTPSVAPDQGPDGSDLILDRDLIAAQFPYLTRETVAVLHARRCGSLSAQQLGMYLLEEAREHGVRFIRGRVDSIDVRGGRVRAVRVQAEGAVSIVDTPRAVVSPGPYLRDAGRLLDIELPVYCERHLKISVRDHLNVVPAEAPLMIWMDPVGLPWSDEERDVLARSDEARHLLEPLPAGVHGRPDGVQGSHSLLLLWTYDDEPVEPTYPLAWDPVLPEIVLRGMSVMVPGLARYLEPLSRSVVDGGYYTKAPDNRPLIGPLPVEGAYVSAAYSGYGIMAACAGGELAAAHVAGAALPAYAAAFLLERFDDPRYLKAIGDASAAGQL